MPRRCPLACAPCDTTATAVPSVCSSSRSRCRARRPDRCWCACARHPSTRGIGPAARAPVVRAHGAPSGPRIRCSARMSRARSSRWAPVSDRAPRRRCRLGRSSRARLGRFRGVRRSGCRGAALSAGGARSGGRSGDPAGGRTRVAGARRCRRRSRRGSACSWSVRAAAPARSRSRSPCTSAPTSWPSTAPASSTSLRALGATEVVDADDPVSRSVRGCRGLRRDRRPRRVASARHVPACAPTRRASRRRGRDDAHDRRGRRRGGAATRRVRANAAPARGEAERRARASSAHSWHPGP